MMSDWCKTKSQLFGLSDLSNFANALTFNNVNACKCESFPCIHDDYQKRLLQRKSVTAMNSNVELQSRHFHNLRISENTSFNTTNMLDDNKNELFLNSSDNKGRNDNDKYASKI